MPGSGLLKSLAKVMGAALLAATPCQSQVPLDSAAISARADVWLKRFVDAGDFSGVVLLAQGDRVVFQKAYGMADPQVHVPNQVDTRFRIASLSKTFTAAAIERLVNDGKLRYSDALSRYVAGIPNGDAITIEQLLKHESGVGVLGDADLYSECVPHAEMLRRLASVKPMFAPGKTSQYSNEGYFLLASVIERVTGESYSEFIRKQIFLPLGMQSSGTACRELPEGSNAYGAVATATGNAARPLPFNEAAVDGPGSVFSNAHDLWLWMRAVDGNPRFAVSGLQYPYGWGKRKYSSRDLIEQTGELAGFVAHMAIYPKDQIYAIVLSNVQSGFMSRIPQDLEKVLFGGTASQPPAVTAVTLGERSMRQYTGRYRSAGSQYAQTLAIRDGQVAMHWGSDPFWRELAMTGGDTFFLRAEYAEVHFERNANGLVYRMVYSWPGGGHLSFEKDQVEASPQPTAPENP